MIRQRRLTLGSCADNHFAINRARDTRMSAVVTPADVEVEDNPVQVSEATQDHPSVDTEDKFAGAAEATEKPEVADATESPPRDEAAERLKRMDAFLEKWVPNKDIWPQLRLVQPPTDVLDSKDLPFEERTLFYSSNARDKKAAFLDSILLPYCGSVLSISGATFVAFSALVAKYTEDNETSHPNLLTAAMVGPLILAVFMNSALFEHPCRVLLYHRLWEHKLVVDFKSRRTGHSATQFKLLIFVLFTAFYIWYGVAEFHASWAFSFVVVQSFGTITWIVYSSLAVDKQLVPINRALRHTRDFHIEVKQKDIGVTGKRALPADGEGKTRTQQANSENQEESLSRDEPARLLASTVAQMRVIPEARVKYDIIALVRCNRELRAKRAQTKDAKETERLDELIQSLQTTAMWIGRLGHSKKTVRQLGGPVWWLLGEMYVFSFMQGLYNDELWHKNGSFAKQTNKMGSLRWISFWQNVSALIIVAIEVWVILQAINTVEKEKE